MPRHRRAFQPGAAYHLIARFVANEFFIDDEYTRGVYLRFLGDGMKRTDWRCFSFAIMSNHVHLGAVAGSMELASWLQDAHSCFADWINRKHDRFGAVFTRGPADWEVRPAGVARLIGYHHMNPVRANLVGRPEDTGWTSQRAYLGKQRIPWLDVDVGLERAGFASGEELSRWTKDMHAQSRLSRADLARHQSRRKVLDVTPPEELALAPDAGSEEWLLGGSVVVGRTRRAS